MICSQVLESPYTTLSCQHSIISHSDQSLGLSVSLMSNIFLTMLFYYFLDQTPESERVGHKVQIFFMLKIYIISLFPRSLYQFVFQLPVALQNISLTCFYTPLITVIKKQL